MGDPKTVLEGSVKYRDKKKWKARWAVVSKLSPVADCLHLQLYRDSKERCKNGPTKASLSLEGFLGMETGYTLDKESNTMALICSELVVVLAFDSRELLIQWQVKIKANLAEEQHFLVQIAQVPPKSKIPCGPARMHLQDHTFCLVAGVPPRLLATWPIKELRRFGVIEGKFCFEGGSLCGKGEGLHVLLTNQLEEMAQSMDLASKGKLLGKRKALTRKNSVLETSTRSPLHEAARRSSDKCSTNDSCRPLLSSGSECSTCDACSDFLRSSDPLIGCDDSTYNSTTSSKMSACRIHYRWPSCMSRWGHSSTITASDVESMDTVSVTLSDYQGPAHSSVSSKASNHSNSLCLCDGHGSWPFNHCIKCGRQFYSRSSLGHQNDSNNCHPASLEPDSKSNFSPQWTMDAVLPSPSCEGKDSNKKDSAYQLMQPSSDRASLCSHISRSSSTSTASSSGSEYSVPRNYLETLYDKPKTLHNVRNDKSAIKRGCFNATATKCQGQMIRRPSTGSYVPITNGIVCPCHEPINEKNSQDDQTLKPTCACWSQLSLTSRNSQEGADCAKRAQPSSSPKKTKQAINGCKIRQNAVSAPRDVACTCRRNDNPYELYDVPRTALATVFLKEKLTSSGQESTKHIIENPLPPALSEDYDVPKKISNILSNTDAMLKSSLLALENGGSCSCKNAQIHRHHNPPKKVIDSEVLPDRFDPQTSESLQMCTCQRVMLWASGLVPCLSGTAKSTNDQGWQSGKGLIGLSTENSQKASNHYGTICSEPTRTAELVLVNGKLKHLIHKSKIQETNPKFQSKNVISSIAERQNGSAEKNGDLGTIGNYENIGFEECENDQKKVNEDSAAVNYANLEFSQPLPLYENSNGVLSRLEQSEEMYECPDDTPPLPPRGQSINTSSIDLSQTNLQNNAKENCSRNILTKCEEKQSIDIKHKNGSAYELMHFEKNSSNSLDDYLMMQPVFLCIGDSNGKKTSKAVDTSRAQEKTSCLESPKDELQQSLEECNLPLRPFMPVSYTHIVEPPEIVDVQTDSLKSVLSNLENKHIFGECMSRKYNLINEEMDMRSTRSNSLSELKKIVLLRKRSSSVDGKNSVAALKSDVKSYPSSPLNSPRPAVHRKNSLFSKLSLRVKEKSLSTNEIIPPLIPTTNSSHLNNFRRTDLHHSADCLKLHEEYVNSDDDLSNDQSESSQKDSSMRRSSSVPCRSAMPGCLPSPRTNVSIIPELNDLNKDSGFLSEESSQYSAEKENLQRKYSLDSHEKPKKTLLHRMKSDCDNSYKVYPGERCGTLLETQDSRKSTTSSSASDISDFIESLSHCSRSSSSSSSSGCTSSPDYLRSEEMYLQKFRSSNTNGPTSLLRTRHHIKTDSFSTKQINILNHVAEDAAQDHSNPSCKIQCAPDEATEGQCYNNEREVIVNSSISSDPVEIPSHSVSNSHILNGVRTRDSSRSSTSSSSSLSISPSTNDSSSSSGNSGSPVVPLLSVVSKGSVLTCDISVTRHDEQSLGYGSKVGDNVSSSVTSSNCSL